MQVSTLEGTSLEVITEAFNHAFSDYFIEVRMTPELMAFKIAAEDIDLSISPGVFVDGKLCGLILHGRRRNRQNGRLVAYNAGTGVRPTHRRQGMVVAMYDFILPLLREKGFDESILEVIDINAPAYLAYLKMGFVKVRILDCFSGAAPAAELPEGYRFGDLARRDDWGELMGMWDYVPTWQHAFETAENTWDRQKAVGIYLGGVGDLFARSGDASPQAQHDGRGDRLVGYGIFTPFSGRVLQFAVARDHRGRGLGKALLSAMQRESAADLRFINVEQLPNGPGEFLYHLGLRRTIGQFEMRLGL